MLCPGVTPGGGQTKFLLLSLALTGLHRQSLRQELQETMHHTSQPHTRVFALSDIHVDYQANMAWIQALSSVEYTNDALILAGDVSDDLHKLQTALTALCAKFAQVFFVPGNHELWVRRKECPDSMAKFWRILELCAALGVRTRPAPVGAAAGHTGVWVVPLFAWYVQPEEGQDSLFAPKEGEDPTLEMWADNYFTTWPPLAPSTTVAEAFLRLNEAHLHRPYDAPVISFSHFVPRPELIYRTTHDSPTASRALHDPHPRFNFSRVAGSWGIEAQIRQLGSMIHVYGHQHRNRYRHIDGVLYISHCLGSPHERERGYIPDVGSTPKLIWDSAVARRPDGL
jgi:predicted phosphodiesterase